MLQLRVLGPVDLRDGTGTEVRGVLAQPKRLALLAYLAVAGGGGFHRRDTLLALFWPESDTERARGALRRALYVLRQALGNGVIVSRGDEEVGVAPDALRCDATDFDRLLAAGSAAEALALYRGDLLAGLFVADAPAFEAWLDTERRARRDRAGTAAWTLAGTAEAAGRWDAAAAFAARAVALAGHAEPEVRRWMELLVRGGDLAGALQVYDDLTARLAREDEVDPVRETRQLAAQIRAARALRAPAERVAAATPSVQVVPTDADDPPPGEPPPGEPTPIEPESGELNARGPASSVPATVRGRRSWRGRGLVLASLAAVLASLVAVLLLGRQPARAVEPRDALVAVLPFSYDGSAGSAYLGQGIMRLLSADLNGAGRLRTVDPHAVLSAVEHQRLRPGDAEGARALAARFGAGLLVHGQIVEAGGRLRITAALTADAASRGEVTVEGPADRLLELVDELTARLLAVYSTARGARLTGLAALTTHSLPALKAYLEGEARLHEGRYGEAFDAFGHAVTMDSSFALAHFRLATAARWLGNHVAADSARARSRRLSSRLPRREQLLVEAWTLDAAGDPLAAERLYRAVLAEHPADVEAWSQLGEVLFHWGPSVGRPLADAREPFERVVTLARSDAGALIHLARMAAFRRDREGLAALVPRIVALRPGEDQALEVEALSAAVRGDRPAMTRLAAGMSSTGSDAVLRTATAVAVFGGDPAAARDLAVALAGATREPAWRAKGRLLRAELEMAQGRWRAAQQELGALDRFPAQMQYLAGAEYGAALAARPFLPLPAADARAHREAIARLTPIASIAPTAAHWRAPQGIYVPHGDYLVGLLSVRLGDSVAALEAVRRLERYAGSADDSAMARRLARGVRARVAWAAGRPDEAFRVLPEPGVWPDRQLPRPENYSKDDERFLHAELLRATGRLEEALRWYATFPDPNGSDLAYLAPSHLRRAEIFDALGRRDSAAVHYGRFVALWRTADPELRPLVGRAVRRLETLGATGRTSAP